MKNIKKLCEKAELSRHIHGELERKKRRQGGLLYAAVQVIMLVVAAAAAAYFRVTDREPSETPIESLLLWIVMILPAMATALIILDATIFRLRDQEEKHKKGVELWGNWIRKAEEARIQGGEDKTVKQIEKRYRKCMQETSNTSLPQKQFIKYKRDWVEKKNQSIELDKEKKWKVCELENKKEDRDAENE